MRKAALKKERLLRLILIKNYFMIISPVHFSGFQQENPRKAQQF